MEKISISDFRANIKQYLDELTDINENGRCVISACNPDSMRQLGDVRNNNRVLLCSQNTFQEYIETYRCFKMYSDCLQAMDLKNMKVLMNAPKLKDTSIGILNSLQTLFDATNVILDIVLDEYPYNIFKELDVSPIYNHLRIDDIPKTATNIPLSLYTFARFLQNTYQYIPADERVRDEPIMLMDIVESLCGDAPLNLVFDHTIIARDPISARNQHMLTQAIQAVQHMLYRVLTCVPDPNGVEKLIAWRAIYISEDAPVDYASRRWKYFHDKAIKQQIEQQKKNPK